MTRIMLVDDHALFRKGLRSLIETMASMSVVAEASDVADAVRLYAATHPDIVLLDMRLPGGSGLDALQRILASDPSAKIVMLSAFDFSDQVSACMRSGARGYLSKDLEPQELFRSIETVCAGGVALGASHVASLFSTEAAPRPVQTASALTPREREVVELAATGKTNREIAEVLSVSPLTVKAHMASILSKLQLHSRVELVSWFLKNQEGGASLG